MKNFKLLLFNILIIINYNSFAQETTTPLSTKFVDDIHAQQIKLEKALIEKDTIVLNQIFHEKLIFGHSNGWTETKQSALSTLPTSKVFYSEFKNIESSMYSFVSDNIATVRRYFKAIGKYENEPFDVNLKTVEVWVKENEIWQLLTRQSVEVDFDE